MRVLILISALVSFSAMADEAKVLAKFTQDLAQFSNPALEALVPLAAQVADRTDLGGCERFVYREQMILPENINYDAALNEFMSRLHPGGRDYTFGSLSLRAATDNSILRLLGEGASDESRIRVEELNAKTGALLNSSVALMSGTAVYSGEGLPDAQMTVRAIVDMGASEFLMFAVGKCE